jgi:hypothetical protein
MIQITPQMRILVAIVGGGQPAFHSDGVVVEECRGGVAF